MADFVVISSSIVRPKNINQSSRVKIHLTPWDFTFFRSNYTQIGLIFPKPDPETDIISPLKASLSIALEIFYPFAGRLVKVENDDDTVSFFIDCDGSGGIKFVHAMAETVRVSDVLEPADGYVPELIKCFLPANGIKNYQGVSEPLLLVQVTELKDGVFFSFSCNHLVTDGFSMWDFIHTWSEINSTDSVSGHQKKFPPLRLKGWFLNGIDYPIHIPVSETNTCSRQDISSPLPISREKILHFSKENIIKLKAKANNEVGSSDRKISSLQAILGHVWRSIVKHSDMNKKQEVHCKLAVDIRQRLNRPLEKECFGSMVAIGTATTTAGELLEHAQSWAALQIHEMVGLQSEENIKIFAETWLKNIKIPNLRTGNEMTFNSLLVSGSPWFNVYDNDFGWGKPIAVRVGPRITANGLLMLFPGVEDGSVDAQICLSSDMFVKMLDDVEFLEYVTII